MDTLNALYFAHPFWIWMAIGAVFLVIEVSTGTGWLLWSAACAAVVAVLTLIPGFSDQALVHLVLWAVLSIASTVTARRYLPRNASGDGPDINDNVGRLIGRQGSVVEAFRNGQGRVFIDGKEWAAIADDGGAPKLDDKVQVISAAGSVLHVTAA